MNLYQTFFFRATDALRGRKTISRLKFVRESQFWDSERLAEWQLNRLNEVLSLARDHSPFYRERLAGVERLGSLDELEQLEVLTKGDIRANLDHIKCENVPLSRFIPAATSGSTGEPMRFFWDKRGRDWNRASVYRSAEWAGVTLGEKAVHLAGAHFDRSRHEEVLSRFRDFLQRYKDLRAGVVSEEMLEANWRKIVAFKPTSIWGYPTALDLLARHVESRDPDADRSFLRAIIPSSEMLRPDQRERIGRVFGNDAVFDHYGSSEFYLGAECAAHDGYHLHSEILLIEIVDQQSRSVAPGQLGRVLVTDLSNRAFPFIRYEIGDLGVMAEDGECPCGVRLPRLQSVEGRISDTVVLADRMLTAPNFDGFFHHGITAYQIRQEALDELKVYVVPGDGYTKDLGDDIRRRIAEMAGESVRVDLIERDAIEVPPSGKRRLVISEVSADHF